MAIPGDGRRGEVGFTGIRAECEDPAIRTGTIVIDPPLADQHAIPITVKTVVLGNRVPVSTENILPPGER